MYAPPNVINALCQITAVKPIEQHAIIGRLNVSERNTNIRVRYAPLTVKIAGTLIRLILGKHFGRGFASSTCDRCVDFTSNGPIGKTNRTNTLIRHSVVSGAAQTYRQRMARIGHSFLFPKLASTCANLKQLLGRELSYQPKSRASQCAERYFHHFANWVLTATGPAAK